MSDEDRRELERRAKELTDWRARVELARLRARMGELEILGESRSHLVTRDRLGQFVFYPLGPDENSLDNILRTLRTLGRPIPSLHGSVVRPQWEALAHDAARFLPAKFIPPR